MSSEMPPMPPLSWSQEHDSELGADVQMMKMIHFYKMINESNLAPHEYDFSKISSWMLQFPEFFNESIVLNSSYWDSGSVTTSNPLSYGQETWLMRAVDYFSLAYIPVIVAIGMVSNLTCIVVFMTTYFRQLSLSYYLTALSASNTIFLSLLLVFWLQQRLLPEMLGPVLCKLTSYLTFITRFLSDWYTVAFTVERYIVVVYPLRRATMCTVHRAKAVITSLAVFSFIFYCLPLVAFTYNSEFHICDATLAYSYIIRVFEYCDTILHLIIPYFAIFTLNILILRKLRRLRHRHGEILFRVRPDQCTIRFRQTMMGYTKSSQLRFTKMLLITSFTTLLLSGPSYGMQLKILIDCLLKSEHDTMSGNETALFILFQDLYYANFSINFLLYSLGGSNFRKVWRGHLGKLLRLCCCCVKMAKSSRAIDSCETSKLKEALVRPMTLRPEENGNGKHTVTEMLSPATPEGKEEIHTLNILFKVESCTVTKEE